MKRRYAPVLLALVVTAGCDDARTTGLSSGVGDYPATNLTAVRAFADEEDTTPAVPTSCTFDLRVAGRVISTWRPLPLPDDQVAEHAWDPHEVGLGVFPTEVAGYVDGRPAERLTVGGAGLTYRADVDAPGFYPVVVAHGGCVANGNIEFFCDDGPRPDFCMPVPR